MSVSSFINISSLKVMLYNSVAYVVVSLYISNGAGISLL